MADKMAQSIVEVLQGERRRERADRHRHLRPVRGRRVRARGAQDGERLAGDVRGARRQDAGRDRVPEDLERVRRRVVLEDRARVAEAGRHARATSPPKVNEYLYENGFDFVYDIIVASGGNTSPYRRWHTDKVIRAGRPRDRRPERDRARAATSSTSCAASRSAAAGRRRRRTSTRSATSRCTRRSSR